EVGDEDGGADRAGYRKHEPPERVARQQPAEERDGGGRAGDEEGVPEPVRERGLLEQVPEVLEGRMERPEGGVVDGPPRAVELGIWADGGDQHPVEGEERPDHEHGERNVEVHPPLPLSFYDHLVPGGSACCRSSPGPPHQLLWCHRCAYAPSRRRR